MEFGEKLQELRKNKDIFNIWDFADINDFPSADEQRVFANQWYKSLERRNG